MHSASKCALNSQVQKGTRFYIILCLQFQNHVPHPTTVPCPSQVTHGDELKLLRNKHILIVDDELINRKLLSRMLEKCKCKVSHATSRLEALQLVQSVDCNLDLILMDVLMPIMDANQATRAIRLVSNVSIIGLSGNCLDSDVACSIQAGMNSFCSKPASRQTLINALASQFRKLMPLNLHTSAYIDQAARDSCIRSASSRHLDNSSQSSSTCESSLTSTVKSIADTGFGTVQLHHQNTPRQVDLLNTDSGPNSRSNAGTATFGNVAMVSFESRFLRSCCFFELCLTQ